MSTAYGYSVAEDASAPARAAGVQQATGTDAPEMFKDRKEKRTEGCVSMNAIAVGAGKRCLAVRAEVSENSDRRGIAAAAAPGSSKNIAAENMSMFGVWTGPCGVFTAVPAMV
jgi:hypothetical protein